MILFLSIVLSFAAGAYVSHRYYSPFVDRLMESVGKYEQEAQKEFEAVEHRACDVCGELKSLFRSIEGRGTVCRDCEKK